MGRGLLIALLVAGLPAFGADESGLFDFTAMWSRGRAAGKGPVRFTRSPLRIEDIEKFVPYGLVVGGHVCPIDHAYFFPKQLKPGQEHFDVTAPADGFIVMVAHRTQLIGSTERARDYDDYALIIEHSGTFYTQYDLLTALAPTVLGQLDDAVLGVVLAQVLPKRKLKFEAFPGKTRAEVNGFTGAARMYER
jgi:hypothetical protein